MKTLHNLFILFFSVMLLWACKDDEAPAPLPANDTPVAHAGSDASTTVGVKFEVDGSKSSDPKGAALVYAWTVKSKPQGSTASLLNADKVKAEFTADLAGTYVFELVVNNAAKSAKDEVSVVVAPPAYNGCIAKSGTISTPTTWTKIAPPGMVDYCITQDIWLSSTLTIEPGVIIEVENGKLLQVEGGVIKAIGQQDKRIVFTGKSKTKGFWKGIELNAATSEENEFNFVDVAYAGSTTHASGYKAGISMRGGSKVKLKNTSISHSAGYGMAIPGGRFVEFEKNSFSENSSAALYITPSLIGKLDGQTQFAGNNGRNGVEIDGAAIDAQEEQFWPALSAGSKYFMLNDVYIYSGVRIEPGAVFEFASSKGIVVEGVGAYLQAVGSADKNIVFTGIEKVKGAWKGIEYSNVVFTKNELAHVALSYAGSNTHASGYKAGISFRNSASIILRNSSISNSGGYGVAVGSGNFETFAGNSFSNNQAAAMVVLPAVLAKLDKASAFKAGNGRDGVEVLAGSVNRYEESVWPAFEDGSSYYILGTVYINSGVKIEEGASLQFASNKALMVEGGSAYLFARGSASKQILFTGIEKNSGFWKGIEFSGTHHSKNEFDYCQISYGGSSTHTSGYKSNVSLRNSAGIKMYNTKVSDSSGWGIAVTGSSVMETDAAKPVSYTNNISGNLKAN